MTVLDADQGDDPPRFLVDTNCGRLATWLRLLGFDAVFPRPMPDRALLRQAAAEGRWLLTRDRGIAANRWVRTGYVRALLVQAEDYGTQVREVVTALGLLPLVQPFTRCPVCNTPLRPLPLAQAWGRVPQHVYQTQSRFDECGGCHRVYWRGSHHRAVEAVLAGLAASDAPPS